MRYGQPTAIFLEIRIARAVGRLIGTNHGAEIGDAQNSRFPEIGNTVAGRIGRIVPARDRAVTAITPVSYTHLDVYKRQGL